jgi:glycosyltransferase involved in cell wall biosynthesis
MKICFVTIDYHSQQGGGGIGSYIYTLSKELVNYGHNVSVICSRKKGDPEYENVQGVKIYRVHLGNIHYYLSKLPLVNRVFTLPVRELEWSYAFWKKVREINEKESFDIIESCETGNLFSMLFPPSPCFLPHKCPWIIRAHGATYSFKKYSGEPLGLSEKIDRLLQRYCMKHATALSAPSKFQAGEIEAEIKGAQKVEVIPNPVDNIFFKEIKSKRKDVSQERKKKILYTGRIELRKGTLVLLKAMEYVIKEFEGVELIIAGGHHVSISQKVLDEALDSGGIRKYVKLLGHVERSQIIGLYNECDIFAVPSYYETFCISAAEAMACGRPVVGTLGTALPKLVEDGKTGLLVPSGDDRALADALLRLVNDDELAMRMGEAGREKVLKQYQASFIAQKTLKFYEDVITKLS